MKPVNTGETRIQMWGICGRTVLQFSRTMKTGIVISNPDGSMYLQLDLSVLSCQSTVLIAA